jgi:hypothetical protein
MLISRAIVSTDNNATYFEFWPTVARAWKNFKIEPTIGVVGDLNLNHNIGTIIKLSEIEEIPSSFIAQVIRFIIPCFFPEEVSIIGDIDMIPLNKKYFTTNVSKYDNESILLFSSDAYTNELRYPMCYIAAKGKYFQRIIGLENTDLRTIKSFIKNLYSLNLNWHTDEIFFAHQLHRSDLLKNAVFLTRGGWRPFAKNRIDRCHWHSTKLGFVFNKYIDAHCVRPLSKNMHVMKDLMDFVEHGSQGNSYLRYLLKKPFRIVAEYLSKIQQNFFNENFYEIDRTLSLPHSRKIIAFSLYGSNPRYLGMIRRIIKSYLEVFEDWKCRIYVGNDVDIELIRELGELGCDVVIMKKSGVDFRYSNWRFLAIEDKKAEAIIIRDLDSMATFREKVMVDQWLSSDKKFHIIRDHANHSSRIMAGMWGIKRNSIDIVKESKKILMKNLYGVDQVFLETLIYPLVKDEIFVHDSFPRFPDENPIVIPYDKTISYIGEIATSPNLKERDHNYSNNFNAKYFVIQ